MMKHKKLNVVSLIVYIICFAWSLLYFWVLAGPTGLMSMLVWQYLNLFILCPAILTFIHVLVKGTQKETLLMPVIFSILSQVNYTSTWNLMYVLQGRGLSMLFEGFGNAIIMTLLPSFVALGIACVILCVIKLIKSKKERAL